MKSLCFFKVLCLFFFTLILSSFSLFAQPVGATISNPINAGTLNAAYPFSDSRNNSGYTNNIGQSSDDIYYKFTLASPAEVSISHCSSGFDTYMHLLSAGGSIITQNDDNGPLCAGLKASIKIYLSAGTYYAVSEGYGSNTGVITTVISLSLPTGATMANAIDAGTLIPGTFFTDTKNNAPSNGFINNIGQSSDDIYYKFTLASSAEVSISHCSSGFDTYMHLLNASGTTLASNDDNGPLCPGLKASVKMQLPAGVYYAVSEGYGSGNGNIITSIGIDEETEGENTDGFANKMQLVFQHVDRTPVSTGILMDAGVEFLNMDNYSGSVALHDSNYVDPTNWRSIYGSLLSAQFNSQVSFTNFPAINAAVNAATADNMPLPFMLLNYNYQGIRSDAISGGLMYVNNEQLYDVVNRPSSPYLVKTAFAVSPAKEYVVAPGGYVDFIFKPELMFGNTGKIISQIQVEMGDGSGLRSVVLGTAFTAQYTSSGIKNIAYRVSYTDNSTYNGHSKVYIHYQNETETPGGGDRIQFFHAIPDTVITVGSKTATLQIRLSNQNLSSVIKKPLIIVEGIDFWKITTPNNTQSNTTVEDFLSDRNLLVPLFPAGNLRDSIDLLGYDIIFIDFADATDYLENNSALVQAAITWVNTHKQPLNGVMQQNVVLGISMGGVLARHALRSMELGYNTPHDTRLYISMDSPHQGANFPLGLQAMVQHLNKASLRVIGNTVLALKDQFPGLELAKQVLDAPASRQLLVYRIGEANNLPVDNSAHDNFYSTYHSMGMPVNCRNIAISNGSECGIAQPFSPLTTLFDVNTEETSGLPGLINLIDAFTASYQVFFGAFTNKPFIGLGSLLGIFSTRTSFYSEFYAKALPDHQSLRIYRGRLGIRRRVLGLFNVNSNITNRSAYSESYMLPLDNSPGGQALFESAEGLGIPAEVANIMKVPGFSYLPTVSSLDIGAGNITINTSQLMSAYSISNPPSSPYNTPFASFITAVKNNEDHVTFTSRNGSFLLKELSSDFSVPTDCNFSCYNLTITGPNYVCQSGTPFYISNLPSGVTVNWNYSSNITVVSGQGTASVTLKAIAGGPAFVGSTVSSVCQTGRVLPQLNNLTAGGPVAYPIAGLSTLCPTQIGTYQAFAPGATSYNWTYSGLQLYGLSNGGSIQLSAPAGFTGGYVTVTASNACGTSYNVPGFYVGKSTNCGGGYAYSFYPNPANSELTVTYTPESGSALELEQKPPLAKQYDVKLLNQMGKTIRGGKSVGEKVTMNIADVADGTYFLHISDGKKIIKEQIIIEH